MLTIFALVFLHSHFLLTVIETLFAGKLQIILWQAGFISSLSMYKPKVWEAFLLYECIVWCLYWISWHIKQGEPFNTLCFDSDLIIV